MNYFLKLNAVSMLYALMAVLPLELMLNVYRIARLTGWDIGTVNLLTGIFLVIDFIGGIILLFILSDKWLRYRKLSYLTAFLWIPYFVLFLFIFASLFPFTHRGDTPNVITGFVMIVGVCVYPFFILLLTSFAVTKEDPASNRAASDNK